MSSKELPSLWQLMSFLRGLANYSFEVTVREKNAAELCQDAALLWSSRPELSQQMQKSPEQASTLLFDIDEVISYFRNARIHLT